MSWKPFSNPTAPAKPAAPPTSTAPDVAVNVQARAPPPPRTSGAPIEILLVEDNPDDVQLTKEALADSKIANHINHAKDGVEALDYLYKRGEFANARTPDLIFLDLNMPRKNGREVLDEIKKDAVLKHIPVIVLTTSSAEEDIFRSYNLQASAYVIKPVDFNQFVQVIKAIDTFWFQVARYPKSHQG